MQSAIAHVRTHKLLVVLAHERALVQALQQLPQLARAAHLPLARRAQVALHQELQLAPAAAVGAQVLLST